MQFLNRNQYCIWFSNRCNYCCSYCCNFAGRGSPFSVVESEPELLVELFNQVDPGVISVSGGEPALWKDALALVEALPQHYWVVFSNLSIVPDWFYHPNVKLVVAAYHEEEASTDRFMLNLSDLSLKTRVTVKILVKPDEETEPLAFWREVNEIVPGHLVSLEGDHVWEPGFLQRITEGELLTSCLYNSRFFVTDRHDVAPRNCFAGTSTMFQVERDGFLSRCSTVHGNMNDATIFEPSFNDGPLPCAYSCYCEWHHWAGATLANDNETWTHFVETGEWLKPTPKAFQDFVMRMEMR